MNSDHDDHLPPFEDPAREREWQLQEEAARRQRLELDPRPDDARVQRYRMVARALRQPLPEQLPADFAAQVASRVVASGATPDGRLESILVGVLALLMTASAAAVVVVYGSTWLPPFRAIMPSPHPLAVHWLAAFGACLGVTWLLGRWQSRGARRA